MTEGYVGADIAAIVKEAVMAALREFVTLEITEENIKDIIENIIVMKKHFESAIKSMKPTTTVKAQQEFEERAEDLVRHAYA